MMRRLTGCTGSASRAHRALSATAVALLASTLSVGCGDDDGPGPDSDGGMVVTPDGMVILPPIDIVNAASVETTAPEEVRAGQEIPVICTILDENGETYSGAGRTARIRVSPEGSVTRSGGVITAVRAGSVEVSCGFADLMLIDDTPASVRIVAGDPAEIITHLDRSSIAAGGTVQASCEVFDAHGNRIEDAAPTLEVVPTDDGGVVDGTRATLTTAGIYDLSCALPGASTLSQKIEVSPSLPANLVVAKVPDEPVYGVGQVIEVAAVVTDQYGNPIADAVIDYQSNPAAGNTIGQNRFRYFEDGNYVVSVTVAPPTEGDITLSEDVTLVVNGNGPLIRCDSPSDGEMVDVAPGAMVTFRGTVDDSSGTASVTVNGNDAMLETSGTFSTLIRARFGINFVDIVAVDSFGAESSRTCAFLASNRWHNPPGGVLANTVGLALGPAAIDDGDAAGSIDSLNDLLHTVVNSPGLRSALHAALLAANPLKPSSCDQSIPIIGCILRSEITYLDSQLPGPNTTTLSLIDGGLRGNVRLENVRVRLRIDGTLSTRGWATFEYVDINLDFDAGLSGGRPSLSVRPGTVSADVGEISTDFGGLSGTIVNVLASFMQGTLKNAVRNLLLSYVEGTFNTLLDGLFGSLDVSSLGSTISVPRIGGGGSIDLTFGLGFTAVNSNSNRLRFGIGTRFNGPTSIGLPTRGVAIPNGGSGSILDDPAFNGRPAAVSIHLALFNQVLHALWRGGLFNATISADALGGGLPPGLSAVLRGALPPVASMSSSGAIAIDFGALNMDLTYPGLFDQPIQIVLGARASTDASLVGNDLSFGAIAVDELFFSTDDVSLDMATRDTLEDFFISLVQTLVDGALNDALPALPIPSFTLPSSVSMYGLPPGTRLGLLSPVLAKESPHFVLRGTFGEL